MSSVQLNRCWACISGGHYGPGTGHTWMDREDALHAGLEWPMSAQDQTANPCACRCGDGPGACVDLGTWRRVVDTPPL